VDLSYSCFYSWQDFDWQLIAWSVCGCIDKLTNYLYLAHTRLRVFHFLDIFSDLCQTNYLKIHRTNLYEICWFGRSLAADERSEVNLSIPQGTMPWQPIFLFNPHNFFRHCDECVTNFVHSASTRSTVIHVVDAFCWQHQYTVEWILAPLERTDVSIPPGHSPLRHFLNTRVRRNMTRSASAALHAGEPINWPSTIINRRLGG